MSLSVFPTRRPPAAARGWRRSTLVAGAVLPLLLAAAACGDDDDAQAADAAPATGGPEALLAELEAETENWPRTYTAEVEDTRALVAVTVAEDGSAVGYLCDGEEVGIWFTGELDAGRGTLVAASGTDLDVEGIDAETLRGRVSLADGERSFTASIGEEGDTALYRVAEGDGDDKVVAGLVVHDGSARGSRTIGGEIDTTLVVDDLLTGSLERPRAPSGGSGTDGSSGDEATAGQASFADCERFVRKVAESQYMAMMAFAYGYSDTVQQMWWAEMDRWLDAFHDGNCYVHYE